MRRWTNLCMLSLAFCFGVFTDTAWADAPTQLTVGLYPWVPRLQQFQDAVKAEWGKVQPGVTLNFLTVGQWDGGYDMNPPANVDVFVYDAMFLEFYRSQNWLEPMAANEIQNLGDFVPYAIEGVKAGNVYYSIPQLGCASLLFYRKSDAALAAATTLSGVKSALGQCTYTSEIPPDKRGLVIDMSGKTTNAALYLDATHSLDGKFPLPLPPNASQLNPTSVTNLHSVLSTASFLDGTASTPGQYDRSVWFSNGWGRAVVAYSESMSQMSEATRQSLDFKIMPLSDNSQPPLFYADVIGVNTTTNSRGTRALAVQLANVMAASATMLESVGPDASSVPQYLFVTRPSALQALANKYPLYQKMSSLLSSSNPVMFKLNQNSKTWLGQDNMGGVIRQTVQSNYVCGCDIDTTQSIPNYAAAQSVCPAVCSKQGGWNGQWTNQSPAAPAGQSACGCNACPSPAASRAQ